MKVQNEILSTLLAEFIGEKDVLLIDYKPIDETTTKESLDFKKVRGSIRLANQNIKTYSDVNKMRESLVDRQKS
jgi:hypothetical protein